MYNRTRKNQLKIYLTDEEKEILKRKWNLQIVKQCPTFLENVY